VIKSIITVSETGEVTVLNPDIVKVIYKDTGEEVES